MKILPPLFFLLLFTQFAFMNQNIQAQQPRVQIANISNEGDKSSFDSIRKIFREQNPGYDIIYLQSTRNVPSRDHTQVIFVQEIEGITNQEEKANATIVHATGSQTQSETIVGDIILLHAGEMLQTGRQMGLLAFQVPQNPARELPGFIRPDWDMNITDTPGGCATEIDAYRRILLTWKEDAGNYIYHALNAHRVRIRDSFSHYHPVNGGFDEFYLVQMAEPGAKIIISEKTNLITNPDTVNESHLDDLMQEISLQVGDLLYLPRGVVHRGFGGVLAQIITVPGFIPGSEIGVDHHLRNINERLNLDDNVALPYNLEASAGPVIK